MVSALSFPSRFPFCPGGRICLCLIAALFCAPVLPAHSQTGDKAKTGALPAPVAQLLLVRPVTSLTRGQGGARDARSLDTLRVGDHITVTAPQGSATLVFYATGARWQMAAGSELVVEASKVRAVKGPAAKSLPPVSRRLLRPIADAASRNKRMGPQFGGQMLRSGPKPEGFMPFAAPAFLTPDAIVVRWHSGKETPPKITVSVFPMPAPGDVLNVVQIAPLKTLIVDSAAEPLRLPAGICVAGGRYRIAFDDGAEKPAVMLRVLTVAERADVEKMARDLQSGLPRANAADATPELMRGLFWESQDLLENARDAYADALRRSPGEATATQWLKHYAP